MHTTQTALPERLHGMDALRGLALLLGVLLHATMSYLPGAEYVWIVSDDTPSSFLAALFYVVHQFRMPLFFLIAGYFAHLSLQRLGTWQFARDRGKRIVLPLLGAWPIVFTGIVIAVIWAAWLKAGGSFPKDSPPGPKFTPDDFPLTHLWFLYVLTIYYIVAVALRALLNLLDRHDYLGTLIDSAMRLLLGPWAALLLGLPVAALLATHNDWYAWFGVPTPDQSLYPNLPALLGFGCAFAFGWFLYRQPSLLERIGRSWMWNLALAVSAIAICWSIIGINPALEPAKPDNPKLIYAIAYGCASWAMSLALLGLALRYMSGHSVIRRYLADASYWVYLVHLPIVMLLQVTASLIHFPWWVEYPLSLLVGLALMLSSYQWLVRYTWVGALLNGRRVAR